MADPLTIGMAGAALGGLGGLFGGSDPKGVDWDAMRHAKFLLGQGEIGRRFEGLQQAYAPMMNAMSQASQVGANIDTQSLQARLAAQGLGGTGLGTALGAGLRTGANLQTNLLRAKMAAETMNQSIGIQGQLAGMWAQGAMAEVGQPQGPNAFGRFFQGALSGGGLGLETASLLGNDEDDENDEDG